MLFVGMAWVLDEHMRALLVKDRPYKCELCQMRFTQSSSLNRHKKIHTGGFTYLAPPRADFYLYKSPRGHISLPLTSVESTVINIFSNVRWFRSKEHRRALLAKEQPYQCDICLMRFTQKSSLGRHGKIHTGGCLAIPTANLCVTFILEAERH